MLGRPQDVRGPTDREGREPSGESVRPSGEMGNASAFLRSLPWPQGHWHHHSTFSSWPRAWGTEVALVIQPDYQAQRSFIWMLKERSGMQACSPPGVSQAAASEGAPMTRRDRRGGGEHAHLGYSEQVRENSPCIRMGTWQSHALCPQSCSTSRGDMSKSRVESGETTEGLLKPVARFPGRASCSQPGSDQG